MSPRNLLSSVQVAAFLGCSLVGCSRAATAPVSSPPIDRADADELYDYRSESFGALRFGLDAGAVERLLGAPSSRSPVIEQEADGLFVTMWDWPAQGVAIELAATRAEGPFEVQSLSIRTPSRLQTARGIGLGANADAIVRAYGTEHAHVDDDAVLVGSPYGGLHFELERGVVSAIFIGAAAE